MAVLTISGGLVACGTVPAPSAPSGVSATGASASSTVAMTPQPRPAAAVPSQQNEISLPRPIEEAGAAALNGHLYVFGGLDVAGNSTARVEVFDGSAWGAGPSMPQAGNHIAVAVRGDRIVLAGGYAGAGGITTAVTAFDGTNWTPMPALRYARTAAALLNISGTLVVIGGRTGSGEVATVEILAPGATTWRDLTRMPSPRDHLAGFEHAGLACVAGGRAGGSTSAEVDCLDVAAARWSRLPDLPQPTSGAGAWGGPVPVVAGGELASEGGHLIDAVSRLGSGGWTSEPMLLPRHGVELAQFQGRVWACGGGLAPGVHPTERCTSLNS